MQHELRDTIREILTGPSSDAHTPTLDELTETYSARYGVLRLDEETRRALRYRHALSCFVLDIDHLEAINQQHGTARGDRVLQDLAAILRHSARPTDLVCRLEGDRFLLIAPRLDARAAAAAADRLRQRIARHRFPVPAGSPLTLTASLGVASIDGTIADAEALLYRALEAVESAKKKGGNGVASG